MDQVRDSNLALFYQIYKKYELPDFVKSASCTSVGLDVNEDAIDTRFYAYPAKKLYPCHSPAATWVSYAYFLEKKAEFEPEVSEFIENSIEWFGNYYGISDHLNALKKINSPMQKSASNKTSDDDYALVYTDVNGNKKRYFPIRNRAELIKSAQHLILHRNLLPFQYRNAAAQKILDKINELGTQLPQNDNIELMKMAGLGMTSAKECANHILNRVILTKPFVKEDNSMKEVHAGLLKLAKMILDEPNLILDYDAKLKLADAVDTFDKMNQITPGSNLVPHVEDIFFGITPIDLVKISSAIVETITGRVYNIDDIAKVPVSQIKSVMGEEIANSMTNDGLNLAPEKVAEIIPTLPRPDAELFDKLMDQLGVRAAREKNASYSLDYTLMKNIGGLKLIGKKLAHINE